jgi:hypothetical protein
MDNVIAAGERLQCFRTKQAVSVRDHSEHGIPIRCHSYSPASMRERGSR